MPNADSIPATETGEVALADWDDPAVQKVYDLLCDDMMPPNSEEHWEGFVSRRIVAALLTERETLTRERDEARAEMRDLLEDLDGVASYVGAGTHVNPKRETIVRRIREGIDLTAAPWVQDAQRYRRLRAVGAAPNGSEHLRKGLVMVATNLDDWCDGKVPPSYACEFDGPVAKERARADAAEGRAREARDAALREAEEAVRVFAARSFADYDEEEDWSRGYMAGLNDATDQVRIAALRAAPPAPEPAATVGGEQTGGDQ